MKEMGKRIYKTSMLNIFRLIVLLVVLFFFNNFYLETFTYEKFQAAARFQIVDVLKYHYRYPAEFLTFFGIVLAPAIYYAFIRGVRFCEKGLIYNGGVPFMNRALSYEDIETYKLLHPKMALSIHTKKGEVLVVADNNLERVIAILDQHNIQGDLGSTEFAKLLGNYRRFIIAGSAFTFVLFLLKKFGIFSF